MMDDHGPVDWAPDAIPDGYAEVSGHLSLAYMTHRGRAALAFGDLVTVPLRSDGCQHAERYGRGWLYWTCDPRDPRRRCPCDGRNSE